MAMAFLGIVCCGRSNLDKNTNIFQCAGNSKLPQAILRVRVFPEELAITFNFAYGVNGQTFVSERLLPGHKNDSRPALTSFYSRKITEISLPADCVCLGDCIRWQKHLGGGLVVPPPHFPHTVRQKP